MSNVNPQRWCKGNNVYSLPLCYDGLYIMVKSVNFAIVDHRTALDIPCWLFINLYFFCKLHLLSAFSGLRPELAIREPHPKVLNDPALMAFMRELLVKAPISQVCKKISAECDIFAELYVLKVADSKNDFHQITSRIWFLQNKNKDLIKTFIRIN